MSLTELRQPLEVRVATPRGAAAVATAWGVIDYGPESDLLWVVILDDGEVWCVPNAEIRVAPNWSLKRGRAPAE